MPERRRVDLTQSGLRVEAETRPLVSGEVHYWRHKPQDWAGVLDRVVGLGLRIICTYIPWSVHEIRRGEFDFGQLDPRRDVSRFLSMAHERGLWVLVRPGPHINAELTLFGFPKRVLNDPEIMARTSSGTPAMLPQPPKAFFIPSYASEKLYKELALYFDALAPVLRKHLAPEGPIVGIQSDNENSFFFRTAPYDLDYHPDVEAKWADFLASRNQEAGEDGREPARRNGGTPMPVFYDPRGPEDLPLYMGWAEFKEELIAGSLDRISRMWRERGIHGLFTFHNFPPSRLLPPFNVPRVERTHDAAGTDFYLQRGQYPLLRKRLLALAGQSRFPFVPELGSGCYLFWPPLVLDDQRFITLCALALGAKGVNFYMIAERDRWYGSPITNRGRIRPEYYTFYKELLAVLGRSRILEMEPVVDWCVALSRDYARLSHSANLLSPVTPMVLEGFLDAEAMCDERTAGLGHCVAIDAPGQLDAWYDHLSWSKVPLQIAEPELDVERLLRYRVLVAPSFEFMARRAQENLLRYAEQGGALVLGPAIPDRDELMRGCEILGDRMRRPTGLLLTAPDVPFFEVGKGRIVLVPELLPRMREDPFPRVLDLISAIEDLAGTARPFAPSDHRLDSWLHAPADKGTAVLFLVNPTDKRRVTDLAAPRVGCSALVDLFSGETFGRADKLCIAVDPYTVRMLEVIE